MAAIGGCTSSHLRPLSLAATAVTLHQLADCEIAAMCGVEDWHSIIEFLMMGATAVEMGSAIMRGYGHITETQTGGLAAGEGLFFLDELRGNALSSLTARAPGLTAAGQMAAPCGMAPAPMAAEHAGRRLPVRCHFSGDGGASPSMPPPAAAAAYASPSAPKSSSL